MRLYDGKSPICWHGRGKMTAAKMKKEPQYAPLFQTECVLFDGGEEEVYSFRTLAEMKAQFGVNATEPDRALIILEAAITESWQRPEQTAWQAETETRLDEQDAALMELAEMIAGGE